MLVLLYPLSTCESPSVLGKIDLAGHGQPIRQRGRVLSRVIEIFAAANRSQETA
jgi:hypothetical protein